MLVVWFGIDVSKKKLVVAYVDDRGKYRVCTFDNTAHGISRLEAWARGIAGENRACFCLESTGDYGFEVAMCLVECGYHVSVVNPAWIKYYGISNGRLNKTDKADSKLIHEYAVKHDPKAWDLTDPEKRKLFRLHRRRQQLIELIKAEDSRRECPRAIGPECVASIKRTLKMLRAELREIERQIEEAIRDTPRFAAAEAILGRLPNFGIGCLLAILAEMPDIESCASAKSFAAAAGGNATAKQSGTTLRSSPMNRGGRRLARAMLWMPTLNWIRSIPEIGALYRRLRARGRLHRQAMVACIHKFLMIVYGILKHGRPYETSQAVLCPIKT